jgi:hypothetical protein
MYMSDITDNPIAVENVRRLMKMIGIDISTVPEPHQKPIMDYMVKAFDHYTKQGHDFGNAIAMAWESLRKSADDAT